MCTGAGGAESCPFRAARFRAGFARPVRRGLSEIPYLRPLEALTDSTARFPRWRRESRRARWRLSGDETAELRECVPRDVEDDVTELLNQRQ